MQITEAPYKVALSKLRLMVNTGYMEYGTSLDNAWWEHERRTR